MFKLAVILALALSCHGFALSSRAARSDQCRYYLYNRANLGILKEVFAEENSLKGAGFTATLPTVFIIHGHGGTALTSLNPLLVDVMLKNDNVNIVTVDWGQQASGSYSGAVLSVPLVAASIQNFIAEMVAHVTIPLTNIHLVGFNLGAHVAGIASRPNKVARITGLDPAGSQWGATSQRLKKDDATYVEVLHTDTNGLLANGLGVSSGTVDFFANGGGNQPGCLTHSCCHQRAFELFAASFVNEKLLGFECSSNLQMSLNMCSRTRTLRLGTNELFKHAAGIYRLNTGRSYPF